MKTLLSRIKPEIAEQIQQMPNPLLAYEILNSQSYWTELTLNQSFDLMLLLNLKTIEQVINIFETPTK
jgi:hypothetical protein